MATITAAIENKLFEFDHNKIAQQLKDIKKLTPADNIFKAIDKNGENLIHAIIRAPNDLKLSQHIPSLATLGANLNYKNVQGLSPLFLAVHLQHIEALKQLYKARVELTTTTVDGSNILDFSLAMTVSKKLIKDPFILELVLNFLKKEKITLIAGGYLLELAENGHLSYLKEIEKLAAKWKVKIDINCNSRDLM